MGYLLDQIRLNGEDKELVEEVVRLSKRYGITTPYTSYLIMPDAPLEVASAVTKGSKPTGGRAAVVGDPNSNRPAALADASANSNWQGQRREVGAVRSTARQARQVCPTKKRLSGPTV